MDTSQHKLGRYCNRIKSTHTFLFCILSAIHKLQNTNAGGPGTWWTSPGAEFTCYPKYLYYQTPINQPWTQCNSCLYLYHNKLVGFVLHDKEHTMPITLVPELCCLIIGSGREDNSKFRLLDLISFLKISDYDFFQANFFSQLYFYEKETDGCWLSISAVFHSDRTSQSSTRSPPQNHINNNHITL